MNFDEDEANNKHPCVRELGLAFVHRRPEVPQRLGGLWRRPRALPGQPLGRLLLRKELFQGWPANDLVQGVDDRVNRGVGRCWLRPPPGLLTQRCPSGLDCRLPVTRPFDLLR